MSGDLVTPGEALERFKFIDQRDPGDENDYLVPGRRETRKPPEDAAETSVEQGRHSQVPERLVWDPRVRDVIPSNGNGHHPEPR